MASGDMATDWHCCRALLLQGILMNTTDQASMFMFNDFLMQGSSNNVWATFGNEPSGRPQFVIEAKKVVHPNGGDLPETKTFHFARAFDGQWFELARERWSNFCTYGAMMTCNGMAYCNHDMIHHRFSVWKATHVMTNKGRLRLRRANNTARSL